MLRVNKIFNIYLVTGDCLSWARRGSRKHPRGEEEA